MGANEFSKLQPGDVIRSFVQPDQVFTIVRKTSYGFQIRKPGQKRPGRAITPSAWIKVAP